MLFFVVSCAHLLWVSFLHGVTTFVETQHPSPSNSQTTVCATNHLFCFFFLQREWASERACKFNKFQLVYLYQTQAHEFNKMCCVYMIASFYVSADTIFICLPSSRLLVTTRFSEISQPKFLIFFPSIHDSLFIFPSFFLSLRLVLSLGDLDARHWNWFGIHWLWIAILPSNYTEVVVGRKWSVRVFDVD